jgi:polyhydroxybutyrate depolymerase
MFKKKIVKQFRFSISSIISKYLLVSLFPLLFIVFLSIAADCRRDDEGKINGNETTEQKNFVVGLTSGSVIFGGLERDYIIYIPKSFDGKKKVPLLFVLHGGGGTPEGMIKLTKEGFHELADKEGFVVVYPAAYGRHWNDGRKGMEKWSVAHKENIDDVGFISYLIDHIAVNFNIDLKKVFITGISNGAMMSFRLACELSQKITAVAPVAGLMPEDITSSCNPQKPVSLLIIMGTEDPLVPYNGGYVEAAGEKRGKVLSAENTAKFWAKINGCELSPQIGWEQDKDPSDGTRVKKEIYNQCKDGKKVILCTIEGGGHTWPGGLQYLPERIIGKTSKDLDANQLIWDFFKESSIR